MLIRISHTENVLRTIRVVLNFLTAFKPKTYQQRSLAGATENEPLIRRKPESITKDLKPESITTDLVRIALRAAVILFLCYYEFYIIMYARGRALFTSMTH